MDHTIQVKCYKNILLSGWTNNKTSCYSNCQPTCANCCTDSSTPLYLLSTMYIPYALGVATFFSIKHPNPERLVVTEGIPITVHSAVIIIIIIINKQYTGYPHYTVTHIHVHLDILCAQY